MLMQWQDRYEYNTKGLHSLVNQPWKILKIKEVSSDQAAEIATDFAELVLGKDEAKRIAEKINAFVKKQEDGV